MESLGECHRFVLPVLKTCKHLSSFILKLKDGARALFEIQPGTGFSHSVSLHLPGYSNTFATPEQQRKVYNIKLVIENMMKGGDVREQKNK